MPKTHTFNLQQHLDFFLDSILIKLEKDADSEHF